MSKLILLVGMPGSGKSTYCKEHFANTKVVSSDEIRKYIFGTRKCFDNEKLVWAVVEQMLRTELKAGRDVVLDATNKTVHVRSKYIRLAKALHARIEVIYFNVTFETAVERNAQRPEETRVPIHVIEYFNHALEAPSYKEGFDRIIKIA